MKSSLFVATIKRKDCYDFIDKTHRHHIRPQGDMFRVAVWERLPDLDRLVGVGVCGRPTYFGYDDGDTVEITRVCVLPDSPRNICSIIYSRLIRAAEALGYTKAITYALSHEHGTSIRASGFTAEALTAGGDWGSRGDKSKLRSKDKKDNTGPKWRFVKKLNP